MTLPDPPSLTPEERDLAQRLAQSGPPSEPSPAVDARILAAARVAAASTPPAARSARQLPHRRWPVALGLAASLVLAVGIAWQLRPLPETRTILSSEAPAASPAGSVATPAPVEPMPEARSRALVDSGTADPAPAAKTREPASTPRKSTRIETRKIAGEPAEPAIVFDMPAQPSAAKTAAPVADDAAPQAFESTAPSRRAAPTSPPPAPAATQAQSAANEAARAAMAGAATDAGSLHEDEPADDVPPATADSPAVRDAWLQRIRGLVDDGDVAAARASLHEFVRRYPEFTLPEDLRALER